jgi:hypothetical protein
VLDFVFPGVSGYHGHDAADAVDLGDRQSFRPSSGPPEQGAQPCDELLEGERSNKAGVGARLESVDG